jgi:hypothetical protein
MGNHKFRKYMIAYTIQKIKGGAYTWKTGFYSLLPFYSFCCLPLYA